MKAITSKILSLMLLACVCANFVSCKKDKDEPAPSDTKSLVGVWRLYTYENGQKIATESYFRFRDDYTADLLGNTGTDAQPVYLFCTGTYASQNGWTVITYTSRNYYSISNNIMRCDAEFKEKEAYLRYSNLYVKSHSGTEIEADLNDMKVCLQKSDLPSYWRSEFSETPVTPSYETMASQWDLVSRYELDGDAYQSWWYHTPEQAGITFARDGGMGKCNFWANEVWALENQAGRVGDKDGISFPSENCTWMITGKILYMTCSSYDLIKYDESGTEISRQTVTPETPIKRAYNVYTLTDSWMTLYSTITLYYYSFLRHPTAPSSAPIMQSGTSSRPAMSPILRSAAQTPTFQAK